MAWTPRSDTGGGNWSVFYRVLARRATKAAAQEQAERPGATLTVTLDAVSLTAAGVAVVTPYILGSVDSTLDAVTLSGSGGLVHLGTAAITLSPLTVTGSSTLRLLGTAAITLGAATVSSSASVRKSGSLTATLGALTQAPTPAEGTLDFYRSTYGGDWTTGQNPPHLYVGFPSNESVRVGDWIRFRADDSSGFGSPQTGAWTELTSDIMLEALGDGATAFAADFGGTLAGGTQNFQAQFGWGTSSSAITATSAWFGGSGAGTYITDTVASAASATLSVPNPLPAKTNIDGNNFSYSSVAFTTGYAIFVHPFNVYTANQFDLTPSGGGTTINGTTQGARVAHGDGTGADIMAAPISVAGNYNCVLGTAGSNPDFQWAAAFSLTTGNPNPVSRVSYAANNVNNATNHTLTALTIPAGGVGIYVLRSDGDLPASPVVSGGTLLGKSADGQSWVVQQTTSGVSIVLDHTSDFNEIRAVGYVFAAT